MHYCAPLANKLGVETRISTTLVDSVGARVITFAKPRRSSPSNLQFRGEASQDDACTNVIALEAYSEEVTLNGYSSHQCIGNTGIRIRVFSGWMGSIGRYCREKEGKFREAIYLDRKERSFKCFSLLFS